MAISDSVNALFLSILGRPADAATLAADVAAVNAGMTLSQLASMLASSTEAVSDIIAAYQTTSGRTPNGNEIAIQSYALANGSLAGLQASIASEEAGIQRVYSGELGRPASITELSAAEQAITGGQSVAAFKSQVASSFEAQMDIRTAYEDALGRPPTAAEVNIQEYALANSALASLEPSLVSEQAGIQSIYAAVLGRVSGGSELAAAEGAITGGETVAAFTSQLATSSINSIYVAELGRAPTAAELSAAQNAVTAGGTTMALQVQLATSVEAQADIGVIYQQVLGRAPTAVDLAASEQLLATGAPLEAAAYNAPGTALLLLANGNAALLPASGRTVATFSVAGQLINGSEAVADITAAYRNAVETAPSAVELASAQSELNSGVTINQVRTEIDELAGGRQPQYIGAVQITPQILAGTLFTYVYSALNDDAVVTGNTSLVDTAQYGSANLTGFNAATDTLQIQAQQDLDPYNPPYTFNGNTPDGPQVAPPPANSAVVSGVRVLADPGGSTVLTAGFGNDIRLNGVPQVYPGNIQVVTSRNPASLQAAIVSDYQAVLGRAPTSAESAAGAAALSTVTQLTFMASLASESTIVNNIYARELGRAPTASELMAGEGSLAPQFGSVAGYTSVTSSLMLSLAVSAEAQSDIRSIYASALANAFYPTPAQLSTDEALLANGASLYAAQTNPQGQITTAAGTAAVLPVPPGTGPVVGSVAFGVVIQAAPANYENLNGVETAALQSLLFSGVPASVATSPAFAENNNSATLPGNPLATITPQTVSGLASTLNINGQLNYAATSQPPTFIYGLFDNDSIISSNGSLNDTLNFNGAGGAGTITGFNPATDVLQYQASEAYAGPSTAGAPVIGGVQVTASGSSTVVHLTGSATITLAGVSPGQLSAPNFQSVPNQTPPVYAPV